MKIFEKKKIVVTGGTLGLGYQISKMLVENGADLIFCSRNTKKLNIVKKELIKLAGKKQKIFCYKIDVSKEKDIESLFKKTKLRFKKIDILISNAGVYGPRGYLEDINWNEWKKAFNTNFFGSVYLIKKFLRLLRKSKKGKIIQLSGGGATSPLAYFTSYASSKAAIVRFTETLGLEILKYKIDINCIAPGALNTRLLNQAIRSGPKKIGNENYKKFLKQKSNGGAGYQFALELCKFLCSSDSDGITGKLISAQWDKYKNIKKKLDFINHSDIFTLRRIIGKDRKVKFLDR